MPNMRQIQADAQFLQSRPPQMSMLAAEFKRQMRALEAERPYLWPGDYDRQVARAKEQFQHDIIRVRVQALEASYRLEQAKALAKGEAGRHNDAARAILEQRAWARILPVLQRQPSYVETINRAQEMIREAGAQGDLATLRAFQTELPAMLEAAEAPDERARRVAVGKSFAEANGTLQRLLADVAAAGAPHLTPEERLVTQIEQQLAPFDQAIMGNLARLEQLADDPHGTYSNVGLVGWSGGYIPAGSTVEEPARPNGASTAQPASTSDPNAVNPAHVAADGTLTSVPRE